MAGTITIIAEEGVGGVVAILGDLGWCLGWVALEGRVGDASV